MSSWKEDYSVGIEKIDKQHRTIFEILEVLGRAIEEGNEAEADWYTVRLLRYYSEYHFDYEEQLMSKYNFPGLENHRKEHEKFKARIYGLKKKYPDDKTLLACKVKDFLQEWVIEHILSTDKQYGAFMIGKMQDDRT